MGEEGGLLLVETTLGLGRKSFLKRGIQVK